MLELTKGKAPNESRTVTVTLILPPTATLALRVRDKRALHDAEVHPA